MLNMTIIDKLKSDKNFTVDKLKAEQNRINNKRLTGNGSVELAHLKVKILNIFQKPIVEDENIFTENPLSKEQEYKHDLLNLYL